MWRRSRRIVRKGMTEQKVRSERNSTERKQSDSRAEACPRTEGYIRFGS